MSTILLDGKTRVTWVTSEDGIADIAAPTVAELNAGTDLQGVITPDGLQITPTDGKVDNSNLGSEFTTNAIGRTAFDVMLKFHHEDPTADNVYALWVKHNTGFLVVRRGILKGTAWTAGQKVKVYPIEVGEDADPTSAAEQNWDYTLPMVVSDDPSTRSVVAA